MNTDKSGAPVPETWRTRPLKTLRMIRVNPAVFHVHPRELLLLLLLFWMQCPIRCSCMSLSIGIRAAVPTDVARILQIERDSPAAAHWPESKYFDAIEQTERMVLVVEESGRLLGFLVASTATLEWELENIAVSRPSQRQGIGRALLTALIDRAREAGASEIRQDIRVSNRAAQRLGQSVGFVQQGCRKGYYRSPEEDALLFNYLLAGPTMPR